MQLIKFGKTFLNPEQIVRFYIEDEHSYRMYLSDGSNQLISVQTFQRITENIEVKEDKECNIL